MQLENGLKQLQDIANKLNDKSITLDESVKLFEEGLKISKDCVNDLKKHKGKITVIKADMEEFFAQSEEN